MGRKLQINSLLSRINLQKVKQLLVRYICIFVKSVIIFIFHGLDKLLYKKILTIYLRFISVNFLALCGNHGDARETWVVDMTLQECCNDFRGTVWVLHMVQLRQTSASYSVNVMDSLFGSLCVINQIPFHY